MGDLLRPEGKFVSYKRTNQHSDIPMSHGQAAPQCTLGL